MTDDMELFPQDQLLDAQLTEGMFRCRKDNKQDGLLGRDRELKGQQSDAGRVGDPGSAP